jgi:Uma2 family endonuclease
MKTALKLGPSDHGRRLTFEEFLHGDYEPGYQYEIIEGRLYVSPEANLPQGVIEAWLLDSLKTYSAAKPEVINFVFNKARVFVPGHGEVTAPEPDIAAYHDFPLHRDFNELRWEDFAPILVVEVVTPGDPDKDFERNVELYLQVPSIREYWVLDSREDANQPTLFVYRRRGNRWQNVIQVPPGGTYTTRLLPDFSLVVDPHA